MDLMRSHRIFTTAELLQAIIERINDPATAARCAQVNRTWYKEATVVLWHGTIDQSSPWRTPDVLFLQQLAKSSERFSYYVSLIRNLVILHGGLGSALYLDPVSLFAPQNWSSCAARTILVDIGSDSMREQYMRALINPSLQALSLFGGYYSDSFFRILRDTCPLRLLLVDNRSEDVTQSGLAECSRFPFLEYLELQQGFERITDTATLRLFLQMSSLKHLCVSNLSFNARLFRDLDLSPMLRSLDITCDRASLQGLFKQLPQLQSFRVLVKYEPLDIGDEVLCPISACHQLCELFIHVDNQSSTLEPTALSKLAEGCPLIHTFDIDGQLSGTIEAHHLTAALKRWPKMMFFTFLLCFVEGFGLVDLATIAKSCPELLFFSMSTEMRESAFDSSKVLFPKLLSFYVEKVVIGAHDSPAELDSGALSRVVALLNGCMPSMTSIDSTEFATDDESYPLTLSSGEVSERLALLSPDHVDMPDNIEYKSVRRDIEEEISNHSPKPWLSHSRNCLLRHTNYP